MGETIPSYTSLVNDLVQDSLLVSAGLDRMGLGRWGTMAEGSDQARQRLGELVLARRHELGLSLREAARRAGIMRPTWTGMEHGSRRTAAYNFAAIERALDWRSGSIEAVLAGGQPEASHSLTSSTEASPVPDDGAEQRDGAGGDSDGTAMSAGVRWSDVVAVLDDQLRTIGQAGAAGSAQRLWEAERITALARRLRPRRIDDAAAMMIPWPDAVAALDATIADVRRDSSVSSEQRLRGVEIIVDIAVTLRGVIVNSGPPVQPTATD
jgi:transcriptional regulator with XRE-family HTH domain